MGIPMNEMYADRYGVDGRCIVVFCDVGQYEQQVMPEGGVRNASFRNIYGDQPQEVNGVNANAAFNGDRGNQTPLLGSTAPGADGMGGRWAWDDSSWLHPAKSAWRTVVMLLMGLVLTAAYFGDNVVAGTGSLLIQENIVNGEQLGWIYSAA
eukprot:TRINITY_DN1098_c1_g1_i1.p1 TRINITY_DN1098_c1_g1~~TRINITY_DN1098_c1_g1_i1.p1  ORF type:complete len:152 (+),score=37.09 TRINITY_DN1098_c1_g1_i1:131-586(+)